MKKAMKIICIITLFIGVGTAGYLLYMYEAVKHTVSSIYEPLTGAAADPAASLTPAKSVTVTSSVLSDPVSSASTLHLSKLVEGSLPVSLQEPFTLLFMGVDERSGDHGRSDSIIVLGVNPAKQSILMFNIPRDTRTEIIGRGTTDKINHAYAFGNVNMVVNTVEHFLNVPIDYYVKVNMEQFAQIIDILGGVKVDNSFEFTYEGVTFPQGTIAMDGHDALLFSRMRYDDPHGDMGRIVRQQNILADIISRAKRITTVVKLPDILEQIEISTKTNLTMDDMLELYNKHRETDELITKDEVKGTGDMIDSIYYYIVSAGERARIHTRLVEQLK